MVVADENRERIAALRAEGVPAVSGDATDPAVLIEAHVARARLLVIATPDAFAARKMMEVARVLNPRVIVVVRSHSDDEAALLRKDSADAVFMGEHELALCMTRYVLDKLSPS